MVIKKSMKAKDCPYRTKSLLCFFPSITEKALKIPYFPHTKCLIYGRLPIERCLKLFPRPRMVPKEFTTGKCLRCGKLLGNPASSSGFCDECFEESMMEMESIDEEEGIEDLSAT